MSIAEKLTTIAENMQGVYDKGFADGQLQGGSGKDNPIYYCGALDSVFLNVLFPENFDFVMKIKEAVSVKGMFQSTANLTTNLRSVKLIAEETDDAVTFENFCFYRHSIETVDLTEYTRKVKNASRMFYQAFNLKSIYGALDLSECTNFFQWLNGANKLEDVEFVPNTIKISIDFFWCTLLSKKSIQSIIDGLNADVTGQTVTLSTTAKTNAFTDEEWASLIATKPNWTISLV